MIRSMTGFGEARLEEAGQAYHFELRSVNQRYLKAAIYLPEDFAFLETDVERLLRARLTRGSVTARLHVRQVGPEAALPLNTAALLAYVSQLRQAAGNDARVTIDLATLLTLPGVCQPRELTDVEREHNWNILKRLVVQALDALMAMRTLEGQALADDLKTHAAIIQDALDAIRTRAPAVVVEYRNRLLARVNELIADSSVRLAETDLLKEVSVYADRSDVSEELSRLGGHLDQFLGLMNASEPAGRKLEFIAQEMLREANTMGSKTGDAEIARRIIEIKSAIDRIKEQVANAE
ncbi:MAG: YicC/YloC family endoribonuclease [Planctomycetota bacterium]